MSENVKIFKFTFGQSGNMTNTCQQDTALVHVYFAGGLRCSGKFVVGR